jgi:hypothetical protein
VYVVYVPQGYVALVCVGGRQHAVLEPGVGVVPAAAQVQYVDLQVEAQWKHSRAGYAASIEPNWSPEGWDLLGALD